MTHTITPIGSAVEWQTTEGQRISTVQLDSTHWLGVYTRIVSGSTRGFAIVFEVDGSGVPSAIGTEFQFDIFTSAGDPFSELALYDSDTAVVVYKGTDNDGFIQALSINTSTWAVTSGGAALEFETDALASSSVVKVPGFDAFVVAARATAGNDGHAFSLTFNAGTGAFTLQNNWEYDTSNCARPKIDVINGDATKYLVTYETGGGDAQAKVLSLNTSTWVLSTTSTLEFDTVDGRFIDFVALDANHFLVVWHDATLGQNEAQVMTVSLSTWAITMEGSPVVIPASMFAVTGERPQVLALLAHPTGFYRVARAYQSSPNNRTAIDVLIVDDSTWAVTNDSTPVEVVAAASPYPSIQRVSDTRSIVWWTDSASGDGFVQGFDISGDSVPNEGEVTGAIDWLGSVTGGTVMSGSLAGVIDWVGVVTGVDLGFVFGSIDWVGEVTGAAAYQGSVAGAVDWVGVVTGVDLGLVFGSIDWVGEVTGVAAYQGEVIGDIDWLGVVTGEEPAEVANGGLVSGTIDWVGLVDGKTVHQGIIGSLYTWVGSVTGVSGIVQTSGYVEGAIEWACVIIGVAPFDQAVFLLTPHVTGHIPGIVVGHKPVIVNGRDGG